MPASSFVSEISPAQQYTVEVLNLAAENDLATGGLKENIMSLTVSWPAYVAWLWAPTRAVEAGWPAPATDVAREYH